MYSLHMSIIGPFYIAVKSSFPSSKHGIVDAIDLFRKASNIFFDRLRSLSYKLNKIRLCMNLNIASCSMNSNIYDISSSLNILRIDILYYKYALLFSSERCSLSFPTWVCYLTISDEDIKSSSSH